MPNDQELVKDYEGGDSNVEPRLAKEDWTWVNYRRAPLSAEQFIQINKGDLKAYLFGNTVTKILQNGSTRSTGVGYTIQSLKNFGVVTSDPFLFSGNL